MTAPDYHWAMRRVLELEEEAAELRDQLAALAKDNHALVAANKDLRAGNRLMADVIRGVEYITDPSETPAPHSVKT